MLRREEAGMPATRRSGLVIAALLLRATSFLIVSSSPFSPLFRLPWVPETRCRGYNRTLRRKRQANTHTDRRPLICGRMRGAFRTQRILRCLGNAWDPEALLLSVLQLQNPSSQTQEVVASSASASPDHGAGEGAPVSTLASRVNLSEPSFSQQNRFPPAFSLSRGNAAADDEKKGSCASFEGGTATSTELRAAPAGGALAQSSGVKASQQEATTELCFTLVAARARPCITFPEILMQWESFVADYGAHYTELLSPRLRRSEAALLNWKLADPVLGQLAAISGASSSPNGTSEFIADVLKSDTRRAAGVGRCDGSRSERERCATCACYGLPHFAAELGDLGYLDALLREFPRGFPLRWLSSPPSLGCYERGAGAEADESSPSMDVSGSAEPVLPTPIQHIHRPSWRSVELHSFEDIAAKYPDHLGQYLSHLASFRGHTAFMDFLVRAFGASFVLKEQRCAAPLSTNYTWGVQRYIRGLNATQFAVAGQQIALLEWIEAEHPSALHSLSANTTVSALIIAAMLTDHRADVFNFFRTRNLFPMSDLLTLTIDSGASGQACGRGRGIGSRTSSLGSTALVRILFAAAEVGNGVVLKWFDEALGRADVRLLCDQHGTTILHHCARGCSVAMLAALLSVPAQGNALSDEGGGELRWPALDPFWVDVEDDRGRTPAMWCVMGAHRSSHVVETLEVLRRAGSDWPRARRGGVSLLDVATRFVSRHSKIARYLRQHMQPASPAAADSFR